MVKRRHGTSAKTVSGPGRGLSSALVERWSRPAVFVLAASGATLGFNNFWQFPYLVGEYGGGAFLLAYLLCATLIGLPLLIAEVLIGRHGRGSPIAAFVRLGRGRPAGRVWGVVGAVGMIGGFLVFSYLSVIASWVLAYLARSSAGSIAGLTADGMESVFKAMVHDPEKQLFWHGLFLFVTFTIVARGVYAGLEPAVKFLMVLVFALLFVLVGYAAMTPEFDATLARVFVPVFDRLTTAAWLAALGQAFFSLSLGLGGILMYGAYLQNGPSIARLSTAVVALDTFTAIAGAVVVSTVLAAGNVAPAFGPSLVFQTLPLAFDHLPYGRLFASTFFALLVVVALLTALALIEPVIAWFGERFGLPRGRAAVITGLAAWVLGLVSIMSFDYWAFSFRIFGADKQLGAFDVLQTLTAQGLLPLAGFLVAVFTGWVLQSEPTRAALALRVPGIFRAWRWLVRWVIPTALLVLWFNLHTLYE